jgi:hypothetical protein
MHALLRIVGIIILIAGLGFMGQGFRYASLSGTNSLMVGHTEWIYYGAGMAVVGFFLIIFSRPSEEA